MTAGIAHRFPVDLRNGFCIRVQQDGGALRAYLDLSDATLTEGLQASTAMSLVYEAATGKVGFLPYAAGGGGDASLPSGGAAGQVLRVATASPRALEWGDTDTAIVATGDGQNTELRLLGRRDGAQTQSVRTGPQTVVHSPAPALGNTTTRGSLVVQAETVEETRAEFLGSYHLLSTKGKSSPHGSADKVALFAGATAQAGSSDLWSLNTVVTADANAGDITLMGYELDCNNQSRHYGDAFGPAGAVAERNFYGLLITGVGTYRKTAAVAITDVVDGAWNRGMVAITGAISATGSFIQDLCNGHQASIDILGAPTYGVRQTSATTKNWFNGSSIFGGQGIIDPAAKLHVEAGALGGGAGQSIEIFRAGAEAGPNGSDRTHLRLTAFRTANGATADTALLRLRSFVNETGGAWLDFNPGGALAIANAGGAALAIGADRTLDASGNRLTGLGAPSAASDAATKAYVDAAGGGGGKVDKASPQMEQPPIVSMPAIVADQSGVIYVSQIQGIDLTGATDMQPLLQSALDVLAQSPDGGTLFWPARGRIRLDRSLNWRHNKPISMIGLGNDESFKIFQYGGGALNFQSQVPFGASLMHVHLERFSIYCMAAGSIAIQIFEPFRVSAKHIRGVAWNALAPNGAPAAPYYNWDKFFNIRNIRLSRFEDVFVVNQHGVLAAQGGTTAFNDIKGTFCFIRGADGEACTDIRFVDCIAQGFFTAWDLSSPSQPGIEGIFFRGSEIVGCHVGVAWLSEATNGYLAPLMDWQGGHINVNNAAFVLKNVAQVAIYGGTIELHNDYDNVFGSNQSLIVLNSVYGFDVNSMAVNAGGRPVSPIICVGGSSRGFIHEICGDCFGAPYMVQADGSTSFISIENIIAARASQGAAANGSQNGYTNVASLKVP